MGRVRKVIEKVNSKSCLLKTRFTIEFNSSQFKSKGIEKRRREVGLEPEGWTQEGVMFSRGDQNSIFQENDSMESFLPLSLP